MTALRLNDRQRVELALLPRILYSVVANGIDGDSTDTERLEANETIRLLNLACMEPLNDLMPKAKGKLARRIERLHKEVIPDKGNNSPTVGKVALTVYYLLVTITEQGILELYEGSSVAEAVARILPHLQPLFDIEKVDASARKQAGHMLAHLQREGYFLPVS